MKKVIFTNVFFSISIISFSQIVYTDIADVTIGADQQYLLDVNNDSNPDYIIEQVDSIIAGNPLEGVQLRAIGNNEAVYETGTLTFLKGFAMGEVIGPAELWTIPTPSLPAGGVITIGTTTYPAGDWADGLQHYAGLKFNVGPSQYYGWVRFTVATDGMSFTVMDYAYHTTVDQVLLAGATVDGIQVNNLFDFNWEIINGNLQIKMSDNENYEIIITDLAGKVICRDEFFKFKITDVSNLSSGIYICSIVYNGKAQSFKFRR